MRRLRLVTVAVAVLLGTLRSETGRNALEVLSLTMPARFFALSGAGVALVDDISAIFLNSSRLVGVRSFEATAGGSLHFGDSYAGYVAVAYPMPLGVFGVSLTYFDYGPVEWRSGDTPTAEGTWSPHSLVGVLSYGASAFSFFSYGLNLKYVQERLTETEAVSAFAADINTHFDVKVVPGLQVGLTVNNWGVVPSGPHRGNPLPLAFVLGVSRPVELVKPFYGLYGIRPALDVEAGTDGRVRVLAGSEWWFHHVLPSTHVVLRTGLRWPADGGWETMGRLGLGLERRNLAFDYGTGWSQDLGFAHRLSLTFKAVPPPERRLVRPVTERRLGEDLREIDEAFREDRPKPAPVRRPEPPPPPAAPMPSQSHRGATNRAGGFDFEEP